MKDFIEKTQLMNNVEPPVNIDPDVVMDAVLEVASNLQELVQAGFDYDHIDLMLTDLLDDPDQFRNTVVSTILSRK